MPESVRALLIDFGNVVGFFDHRIACRNLAALADGRVTASEVYDAVFASGLERRYDRGELTTSEFLTEIRARFRLVSTDAAIGIAWCDMFRANPEIATLLPTLEAAGYRLVLASNTNPLHATWFARQFAPELSHFHAQVLSCDAGCRKPEPAFFEACVAAAGVPADACVFLDDKEEFVVAARERGLRAFVYAPDGSLADRLRASGVRVPEVSRGPSADDGLEIAAVTADSAEATALIADLEAELSGRYPGDQPHGLTAQDLADPRFVFLVGRVEGRPIASAALRELSPEMGELKRMFVAPGWRGRGVAGRLLEAIEQRARARGYRTLRLETGVRQPEAMRVYERAGFTPIAAFGDYTNPLSRCYEKNLVI